MAVFYQGDMSITEETSTFALSLWRRKWVLGSRLHLPEVHVCFHGAQHSCPFCYRAGHVASGKEVRVSSLITFQKLLIYLKGVILHTVWFHLYHILKMTKLWDGEQISGGPGFRGGWVMCTKGDPGAPCAGSVVYLTLVSGPLNLHTW